MPHAFRLALRPGVTVDDAAGTIALRSATGELKLGPSRPGALAALRTLSSGDATEDHLCDLVLQQDGASELPWFCYQLGRLKALSLLSYAFYAKDGELALRMTLTAPADGPPATTVDDATRFQLSRFAYCRRDDQELLLESPLAVARLALGRLGVRVVAELAQPRTAVDLCGGIDGLDPETARLLLGVLESARLVARCGEDGRLPEDRNQALRTWEFHDLLFHGRSRGGLHDYPIGGTFPFLGKIDPLSALLRRKALSTIRLERVDVRRLEQDDLPFTAVLERRQSTRDHHPEPVTSEQLGAFLYRAARVRRVVPADPARQSYFETTSRPYPSAGAAYDLEIYLTIGRCLDITAGVYHYDPLEHQLHKVAEHSQQAERLLQDAQRAAAMSSPPQVLLTFTSRFQRLSWKYQSLAYATTLKNVGVLFQTMYLVATAMGLACCALGSGNSRLLADALGEDFFAESSVGEMILGTAPAPRPGSPR